MFYLEEFLRMNPKPVQKLLQAFHQVAKLDAFTLTFKWFRIEHLPNWNSRSNSGGRGTDEASRAALTC